MKMQTNNKLRTQILLFAILCSGMLCVFNNFAIAPENNDKGTNTNSPVSSDSPTGNHAPIRLDSNTALENYVAGNTTLGTKTSPHIMSNLIIVAETSVHALNLTSITLYLIFRNCTFIDVAGSASAVMLKLVQNLKIENCTIMLCSSNLGISMESCSHIIIDDCVIIGLNTGIYCEDSDNIEILNSRITNSIFTPIYFLRTDDSAIRNCLVNVSTNSFLTEISDCENISIEDSEFLNAEVAIVVMTASLLFLSNCHINNSEKEGLRMDTVSNGSIIGNVFGNNGHYGISFYSYIKDCVVYHNAFIDNPWGSICSEMSSADINNTYDDGEYGNYWSDYESEYPAALNVNGIWDTPFEINGTNGITVTTQHDKFPLDYLTWLDVITPKIDEPDTQLPNFGIVIVIELIIFAVVMTGVIVYINYKGKRVAIIQSKRK